MIIKIILLIMFIALSIWMLAINCITAKTKSQIIIGLGLWILGLYVGLGISSVFINN